MSNKGRCIQWLDNTHAKTRGLESRIDELEKEAHALKAAILVHSKSLLSHESGGIHEQLWSTVLPGFSADGTTLRDPPYPILKEPTQ